MGIHSLPARRWGRIGLVALLGLTLALVTVGAGHASTTRLHDVGATVAKKKCKKKHRSASSAKKKKCKKKHRLAIPGPIVRATLSWPSGEVDLHAFDASGNRSGIAFPCSSNPCPMSEGIPNAVHSTDANNGGSESFTDNIFVQGGTANREFAYAVCFYDDASVTFTGVNKLGQSQTLPFTGFAGEGHSVTATGGPSVPASFSCPA
jgi:hypothetical protein